MPLAINSRQGLPSTLRRLLPFLEWFPVSPALVRSDLIAGITGALVLVPKAMAYARLSGLPVHFGRYVAFVPAILGALWGSSRQLATGPMAIISLMTAAAITPLAAPFSGDYVALAFMAAFALALTPALKRIDPNQELMGQGMANLGGAFFQSYPACGSFTGSAVNLQSGAKTGFAMVFNGLFVVCTMLFMTPYLYHLPKATLGVIILFAVTSLITPAALKHTWRASKSDGIVALTTFFVTLLAAPHLDKGILVGVSLAILIFLYRTMKPRVAQLGRHSDGTLRDLRVFPNLPTSENVIAIYRLLGPDGKAELLNDTGSVKSPTPTGVTLTAQ